MKKSIFLDTNIKLNYVYKFSYFFVLGVSFSNFKKIIAVNKIQKSLIPRNHLINNKNFLIGRYVISKLIKLKKTKTLKRYISHFKYFPKKKYIPLNINISHKDNFGFGVLSKFKNLNVGIDVELKKNGFSLYTLKHMFSSNSEFDFICKKIKDNELTSTLIFCIKESAYKAVKTLPENVSSLLKLRIVYLEPITKKYIVKTLCNKRIYGIIMNFNEYLICVSYLR